MVYLEYELIRTSKTDKIDKITQSPKFLDSVILQSLNIKVLTYILVLFPQFIAKGFPKSDHDLAP